MNQVYSARIRKEYSTGLSSSSKKQKKIKKRCIRYMTLSVISLFLLTVHERGDAAQLMVGQGAQWIASGSRTASQDIDAVWFNPAGTTELSEGFHISFSNHHLIAHGHIENNSVLAEGWGPLKDEYPMGGYVPYLFYLFSAYRTGDFSFMFSIESPGGVGGGNMPEGTPTEHVGATFYSLPEYDSNGQPVYNYTGLRINSMEGYGGGGVMGPAIGVACRINDMISVAFKARAFMGFNMVEASYDVDLFKADGTVEKWQLGGDQGTEVKYMGKGYGYGFGIGTNIKPIENLNIALTVDWFSELELEIDFEKGTMVDFPGTPYDGMKYRHQIPIRIGTGVGYRVFPGVTLMLSYDLGLDSFARQEGDLDSPLHNDVEASNKKEPGYTGEEFDFQHQINLGAEFRLNKTFTFSGGAGYLDTGMQAFHQKDFYQWPDRFDLHAGTEISITETVTLGLAYCIYISIPSESDFRMFKMDGKHDGVTFRNPALITGEQSTYYRYCHIIAWSITAKFI